MKGIEGTVAQHEGTVAQHEGTVKNTKGQWHKMKGQWHNMKGQWRVMASREDRQRTHTDDGRVPAQQDQDVEEKFTQLKVLVVGLELQLFHQGVVALHCKAFTS